MANLGKTGLTITNLKEGTTLQGKAFLLYGPSGTGKTRSCGTLLGKTIHLSLDNGAMSAMKGAELHEIDSVHMEVLLKDVHELSKTIDFLLTDKAYLASIDNVVIDNLVEITSQVYTIIASSKRYKKDQLQIEDILSAEGRVEAENKKGQALYKDAQEQSRNLMKKAGELTSYYNLIVLTADKEILPGSALQAGVYPYINGPSSVQPMTMLFDEVYMITRKDGEFDTKDDIKTKFKLTTFNDPMTGKRCFSKTRSFTGDYVVKGECPADFREVFKHTGYVLKQDRR